MSRSNDDQPHILAATIRRQIGSEANARFLRSMPAFRVDAELPTDLRDMLRELDRAEAAGRQR